MKLLAGKNDEVASIVLLLGRIPPDITSFRIVQVPIPLAIISIIYSPLSL